MRNLCTVDGCTKVVTGNGLCQNHYMRMRRNGTLEPKRGRPKPPCSMCGAPSAYVGLCLRHYHEARRRERGPLLHPGRECRWCLAEIPATRNARAIYCSHECKVNSINQRHREHPGYTERNRHYHFVKYWATFGVTLDDYNRLLAEQNGRCAICETDDPGGRGAFHVDHDHETGQIRGLLCNECNIGLGKFGDDPARLRAAADYLERATTKEGADT